MRSAGRDCKVDPFFLDSAGRQLFAIVFEPVGDPRGQVLFCPPFAEEMNKSRAMIALTARRLAASGFRVLIIDPRGTGDSEGDFGDARWDGWVDDLAVAAQWLARRAPGPLVLWGLRLGAGLALDLWRREPGNVARLLLWQPVVAGNVYMTQFLRLKVAARLTGSGEGVSTAELRERSARGDSLEIAGYRLAPELLQAIDALDLRKVTLPAEPAVDWFDVGSGAEPGPLVRKVGEAWESVNPRFTMSSVRGEPFWTTQEIAMAPLLVDETVSCLERTD